MKKDEEKKQRTMIDKLAVILNYQPKIQEQYIYMDRMKVKEKPTPVDAEVEVVTDGQEEAPGGVDEGKEEELVAQLKPIFYNNEEDVKLFLKMIRGMAQEDITDLVNSWVDEKRISNYGNSRKGKLWEILHDAGLYTKTRANWNGRVH